MDRSAQIDLKMEAWIRRWASCAIPSAEFTHRYVRRALIYLFGEKCQGTKEDGSPCEWSRTNPATGRIPVELDHVDGNSTDNQPQNVRLLCPNCHALTPTFRVLNRGQGRGQKTKEQEAVNYLISEVARRTGRTSLIENERFVHVHEAVPSSNAEEIPAFHPLRFQRFRWVPQLPPRALGCPAKAPPGRGF